MARWTEFRGGKSRIKTGDVGRGRDTWGGASGKRQGAGQVRLVGLQEKRDRKQAGGASSSGGEVRVLR
jgi:hypothetical protein